MNTPDFQELIFRTEVYLLIDRFHYVAFLDQRTALPIIDLVWHHIIEAQCLFLRLFFPLYYGVTGFQWFAIGLKDRMKEV